MTNATEPVTTTSDDGPTLGDQEPYAEVPEGPSNSWTAYFEVTLPKESWFSIHPATYDRIAELFDGSGPVFRLGPGLLGISFGIAARSAGEAQTAASTSARKVLALLRVPQESVVATSIEAPGHVGGRAALEPEIPECVGVGEAAEILRVSKQRISQLRNNPAFPAPLFVLRATPVWRRSDIDEYGDERRRDQA